MAGRVGGDDLLPVLPVGGDALDAPEPAGIAALRPPARTPAPASPAPPTSGPAALEAAAPPAADPPSADPPSGPRPTPPPGPRIAALPDDLRSVLGDDTFSLLAPRVVPVPRRPVRPPPPPPSADRNAPTLPIVNGPLPTPPKPVLGRDTDPDTIPDTPTLVPPPARREADEGDAVPFLPMAALGLLGLVVAGVIGAGLWSWIHRPEAPTEVPSATMAPLRVVSVPAAESPTPQPAPPADPAPTDDTAAAGTSSAPAPAASPARSRSSGRSTAPAAPATEEEENPWLPKEGASEASPPAELEPKKKGLFGKKKED